VRFAEGVNDRAESVTPETDCKRRAERIFLRGKTLEAEKRHDIGEKMRIAAKTHQNGED
jgi:hypothetical protein